MALCELVLGFDYTMRFIGCDSIQSRSLVSDRFETKAMTWQLARIEKNRPVKSNRLKSASTLFLLGGESTLSRSFSSTTAEIQKIF